MNEFGHTIMRKRPAAVALPMTGAAALSGLAQNFMPVPAPTGARQRRVAPGRGAYNMYFKRVLDIVLVLMALPVAVPIIAACALLMWIEGGSPFYRQDRLGQHGRVFSMLKLRSMIKNADAKLEEHLAADPALRAEWDATQKLKNDPRITRLGAFLRKSSLDELPQLWNVLKGEMSLVGPRPMMPEQLPLYGNPVAYFAMKPGITGQWQVSGRNETRFDYRATVDAEYARTASIWADLEIMVKTLSVVARRTGY